MEGNSISNRNFWKVLNFFWSNHCDYSPQAPTNLAAPLTVLSKLLQQSEYYSRIYFFPNEFCLKGISDISGSFSYHRALNL